MVSASRTILIVDDAPEDRELYRRYLLCDQEYAYTFLEAELGAQGLNLWQHHQPDAVLLDYGLPDLDGLAFLDRLQFLVQQPHLPVIVVTGQGNEAIAVQAMKAGAQDYLVKEQLTPEGLQLAVNGAIAKVQLHTQLQQRIERERLVAQITRKIHQTLDLEEILQTTVTEVRQFLHTDRVLIFRLALQGWGSVTTESVGVGWPPLLSTSYYDPCLNETYIEPFRQGWVTQKADIHDGSIDPCHVELLANLQVRANLAVSIVVGDRLWGLLIAHHCAAPRPWQPLEVDLLQELATQVGIALQQAELYQQAQKELAERQQAAAALRESEERFRQLAENIDAVFWIREAATNQVSYVSPAYERFWGLNPQELYADPQVWVSYIHPDDRAAIANAFETQAAAGSFDQEYRILLPDGSLRWVRDRCFPLHDQTGQLYRFTGIAEDITDRKQAEAEREALLQREQAARTEAERANRIKDEFLAILSHELRSPLNPILGWARLLRIRQLSPAQTTAALATIEQNARLQTQLIDDLLDIAKILRGKLNMKAAPVDLVVVIEAAIETMKAAAVAKSISLDSVLPPIGQVLGDATRLQQIVWNLLSNAIKFTPAHGRIDIQLSRVAAHSSWIDKPSQATKDQGSKTKKYAQITVSDTGKGIDPNFLPHIFESFRQEDASITRQYGGLGLGLAIVRYLVEAHGGTIWADSQGEGQGATFTVQLPLLEAETKLAQPETVAPSEPDLRGIRILTVDDEPDARELLTFILTQYGAEVVTVASGMEVLAYLESFQPDVFIIDIGMPHLDGYSLIQQIRALPLEQGGQIPAIALTAYARVEDYEQAIASGYQWHLTKPLELEQLVQAVVALAGTGL